jgi:hypothetical protein
LATIADADLVDAPDFEPQGWPDTFNETFVRFTNRDQTVQGGLRRLPGPGQLPGHAGVLPGRRCLRQLRPAGHVVAEYPADTLLIDDYLGIEIQFDSLDNDLDEITFLEAQQNRLLVSSGTRS